MSDNQARTFTLLDFANALMERGLPYEIAYLRAGSNGMISQVVHTPDEMASVATDLTQRVEVRSVYLIPSPLDPARKGYPYADGKAGRRASAVHVARRRVLFLDIDPNQSCRPKTDAGKKIDMCSTEDELNGAIAYARILIARMEGMGFAPPIFATSGNGVQLLFRWDSDNGSDDDVVAISRDGKTKYDWAPEREPASRDLNKQLVSLLARAMGDAQVPKTGAHPLDVAAGRFLAQLDPADIDASRLCRMPFTWNRKGDDTPERPHRMAQVLDIPEGWDDNAATDDTIIAAIELLTLELGDEMPAAPAAPIAVGAVKAPTKPKTDRAEKVEKKRAALVEQKEASAVSKLADIILAHPDKATLIEKLVMLIPTPSSGTEGAERDWKTIGGHLFRAFEDDAATGERIFADWSSRDGEDRAGAVAAYHADCGDRFANGSPTSELTSLLQKVTKVTGVRIVDWAASEGVVLRDDAFKPGTSLDFGDGTSTSVVLGNDKYEFSINGPVRHIARVVDKETQMEMFVSNVIGYRFMPVDFYVTVGETLRTVGSRVSYRESKRAEVRNYVAAAGQTESKGAAAAEAAAMAAAGIAIVPGNGSVVVRALAIWGHVASTHTDAPAKKLTALMGWQPDRKVYVNGKRAFGPGADEYEISEVAAQRHPSSMVRGAEVGDLALWHKACEKVYTTKGLRLAIGLALAGPLLEVVGESTWGIHLWGKSSRGKSTSLAVAGSVWGYCDLEDAGDNETAGNIYGTWRGTEASLERRASAMNGALLLLDEIGAIQAKLDPIEVIMTMAQGRGKQRQHKDWPQMTWKTTLLSTGEQSISVVAHEQLQDGAMARFIDIEFNHASGDWTRDHEHARECKLAARRVYGIAGNMMVRYLADQPGIRDKAKQMHKHEHQRMVDRAASYGEAVGALAGTMTRILPQLATVATALKLAKEAGIIPWSQAAIDEMLVWLQDCVTFREVKSQEEMAWRKIMRNIYTGGLITDKDLAECRHVKGKIAVVEFNGDMFTTEAMLGSAVEELGLKTGVKGLVEWAKEQGYLGKAGASRRIGGHKQRWMPIWNKEADDEAPQHGSKLQDDGHYLPRGL